MTSEDWVAVYFIMGFISACVIVHASRKMDAISGEDIALRVGLPVFAMWPVVWLTVIVIVVANKIRELRT